MTVRELMELTGARALNEAELSGEVSGGYCCDLLSRVMARGAQGSAWITVMTHMNAVAVATLRGFACVIVPEGLEVAPDVLSKAAQEGLPVLGSRKSAYVLCGLLYEAGLGASQPM